MIMKFLRAGRGAGFSAGVKKKNHIQIRGQSVLCNLSNVDILNIS